MGTLRAYFAKAKAFLRAHLFARIVLGVIVLFLALWLILHPQGTKSFLILGMVSIVVAGYFSMTVSITILACVWCSSIIGLLFKIYYNKKF